MDFICKCGRIVEKSTKAETTGNRDTAECIGCEYVDIKMQTHFKSLFLTGAIFTPAKIRNLYLLYRDRSVG